MYYGKFQGIAPKASQIIALVENRIEQNVEYESLLIEIHKMYLTQRAGVRLMFLTNFYSYIGYNFQNTIFVTQIDFRL